ncbi:hypothetical protein [Paenibacillus koleovorans]|uniref:hypothetical protein n=1 Tax=Paenibacillus koleovorans TaxID=121608 RepID=UPI000FDB6816|nr:hypothetical protein [Paenibacillus koleovorans]
MGKYKKKLILGSALLLLAVPVLEGCEQAADKATTSPSPTGTAAAAYNEMKVSDSSELPNWTGKELKLTYWSGQGAGGARKIVKSGGDVVSPEVLRVTGISIDEDNSYDNGGGQTFDQKLALVNAANDWPSIVVNPGNLKALVENNKVYDLTDLLPKYAPNVLKKIPKDLSTIWNDDDSVTGGKPGKVYAVPSGLNESSLALVDSTLDKDKYSVYPLSLPPEAKGFVVVRDDILKKLYPNAKTQKQIEELYLKNGKFTKEEIFDVPINSKKDFIQMLYDIKQLGIKEGNQEVFPSYAFAGQDNWNLVNVLQGWLDGRFTTSNYFSYFNKKTQKFEYLFKTPQFKESLLTWNKLMRDGIFSKESFIDSYQVFTEKANKGLYAVLYGGTDGAAQNAQFEKDGKPYRYRKVYLNIPLQADTYPVYAKMPTQTLSIAIFKDKVKEEDVPQILKWIDFMVSDTGEKLSAWGPKSAGLWDETNGKRLFKDKDLEAYMLAGTATDKAIFYNLRNGINSSNMPNGGMMPTYMRLGASKFAPAVAYDKKLIATAANTYFRAGLVENTEYVLSRAPQFYSYTAAVPDADKAWKARTGGFEQPLTRVMTADNDAQFDKLFADFLATAEKYGYTDNLLPQIWSIFEKQNADLMKNLK